MGKIKSKPVRNAARYLAKGGVSFTGNFNSNKKMVVGVTTSKKIRNQIAGLLAKINKK